MASESIWYAGACYGLKRHLVPTLPLLLTSLVMLLENLHLYRSTAGKSLTWGLVGVSVAVSRICRILYWQSWGREPV